MKIWISVLILTIYFVGLLYPFAFKPSGSMRAKNKIVRAKSDVINYVYNDIEADRRKPVTEYSFTRLPTFAKPLHYKILLKPDLEKLDYYGDETITVFIDEKTDYIQLHGYNMTILGISAVICNGKEYKSLDYKMLRKIEQIKIYLPEPIEKESIDLRIKFYVKFNTIPHGFYRTFYNDLQGVNKTIVSTHFESAHARNAFPCFDEPIFKATFEISLQIKKDLSALSNSRVKNIDKMDDGTKIVNFESTMHMSTYLVAFVVGEIRFIENRTFDGIRYRAYTIPGNETQAKFALDVAVQCTEFFTIFLDHPLSLSKIDMISVPFFGAGAMENNGLMIYIERLFLLDPKESKGSIRAIYIALVVSHEVSHHWFGNIITMNFWNQLWLKEGFASYMEYVGISYVKHEWNIWNLYIEDDLFRAWKADSFLKAHPMDVPQNDTNTLLFIYGPITYQKGGAVIRMLCNYLGEDTFRRGLQRYIKLYEHGNVFTKNLWNTFEIVSGRKVETMMNSWSKQPGHPIVYVSEEFKNNGRVLRFTQKRFLLNETDPDNRIYHIPISYKILSENIQKHVFVMKEKEGSYFIEDLPSSEVIVINPEYYGFYRVKYSDEMLEKVFDAIEEKKISERTVMGITRTLFDLMKLNEFSGKQFLKFIKKSRDYLYYPIHLMIGREIEEVMKHYNKTRNYKELNHFKSFIIDTYKPILDNIGWKDNEGDPFIIQLFRQHYLMLLSMAGYDPTQGMEDFSNLNKYNNKGSFILTNEKKNTLYIEGKLHDFIDIKEYFGYLRDKDTITVTELASLLKIGLSPETHDITIKEHISMNRPTPHEELILIDKMIYAKAFNIITSDDNKEDKRRKIFDFIKNNFDDHKEAIIMEKFKEIELMDGINDKFLENFALSLGKTMDSEEYRTI